MTDGLNSRPKEWSRPPEPHPPDAGCWCSRNKRRPYVSLIWCSTPSGHGNGLRPWIRTNARRNAHEPLNLTLDCEHAHVSGHLLPEATTAAISTLVLIGQTAEHMLVVGGGRSSIVAPARPGGIMSHIRVSESGRLVARAAEAAG